MSLEKAVENISIHAPTRGATTCRIASFFTGRISIHAPTRGATLIDLFIRVFLDNFNPRSHEGSDGIHFVTPVVTVLFQSTLPRGERHEMDIVKTLPTVISIHAPTRGATPGPATVNSFSLFQSTLPRGERPSWGSNLLAKAAISIHAPTRGATTIHPTAAPYRAISIHAPTRGATRLAFTRKREKLFQSTLPRGERRIQNITEI